MAEERMLVCKDCGGDFVFSIEEQEKYADRGFAEPKRCPACRSARRAQKERPGGDRYSGGRPSGGRPRGRPGGGRETRDLVTITCAACGREAQVPFVPVPGRPVYCPDCYREQRARH